MKPRSVGFVYAIQAVDGGPVKIGWSDKPKERLRQLQGGHHSELQILRVVIGSRRDESNLHDELFDLRLRGEWFTADERIGSAFDVLEARNNRPPMTLQRVASLGAINDGMKKVASCETEEDAAAIMADVGRQMFRTRVEYDLLESAS